MNDASQILAVGGWDRPLSERDKRQADERLLLDLACNRLLFGKVARIKPLETQCLQLFVGWPTGDGTQPIRPQWVRAAGGWTPLIRPR